MAISKLDAALLETYAHDFDEAAKTLRAHMAMTFTAGMKLHLDDKNYAVREVSGVSLHLTDQSTGFTRHVPYGECVELLKSIKWPE